MRQQIATDAGKQRPRAQHQGRGRGLRNARLQFQHLHPGRRARIGRIGFSEAAAREARKDPVTGQQNIAHTAALTGFGQPVAALDIGGRRNVAGRDLPGQAAIHHRVGPAFAHRFLGLTFAAPAAARYGEPRGAMATPLRKDAPQRGTKGIIHTDKQHIHARQKARRG